MRRTERSRRRLCGTLTIAALTAVLPLARVSPRMAAAEPAPRRLTVAATGDIMVDTAIKAAGADLAAPGSSYDFAPLLSPVAPYLERADIAICHMEFPIARYGQAPGSYGREDSKAFRWLAPYELADSMARVGYDRCSTASNHSNDLGAEGLDSTLEALDAVGLGHTGTARSPEEAAVSTFVVNGVRVAHLAYTNTNNTTAPAPFRLQQADEAAIVADVEAARDQGAEIVILTIHLGREMLQGPTSGDRGLVERLTAATHIDLILQHGPHVLQPMEVVNGTPVYWSLGNHLSGMGLSTQGRYADPRTLDGLLAMVTFVEQPDGSFQATPRAVLLCEDVRSRVVYPAVATLLRGLPDEGVERRIQQCIDRSAELLGGTA